MKTFLTIIMAMTAFVSANAFRYSYSFDNTPVADAIVRISKDHPDDNISFIYKELDSYRTSATIRTDDTYDALRRTIGLNPISISGKIRTITLRLCNTADSATQAALSAPTTNR